MPHCALSKYVPSLDGLSLQLIEISSDLFQNFQFLPNLFTFLVSYKALVDPMQKGEINF